MRSQWGAIPSPQAKVFYPPASPSPTSGTWPQQQNENFVFYLLFVRTHTKYGIKSLKLIKWYLTFWPHPKVTSLTLGWKFYLHSVLLAIPMDLICHMTMFEKNKFLTPLVPQRPKVPPLGQQSKECDFRTFGLSWYRQNCFKGTKYTQWFFQ